MNNIYIFDNVKTHVSTLRTSTMELLAKIASNVNFQMLNISAKKSILDVWRSQECVSWCNNVFKIQTDISPRQHWIILIEYLDLTFRSVNWLNLMPPLKQLSEVSVMYCFQENLFRTFFANYQLVKFHAFSMFFWTALGVWVSSMKIVLWDISF